ncbi:MAG: urease accessory protein UreE [Pseudomonadota bacterium]
MAQTVRPAGTWHTSDGVCWLTYDSRFLRRRVIETASGDSMLVDLEQTTSLNDGDALETSEGTLIEVRAAVEPLLQVTASHLARVAWHIGNRHTPCQIEETRLLIQRDHVLADMLSRIGARTVEVEEPFTPEGGAYGHGRTHGHDHSQSHEHAHDH